MPRPRSPYTAEFKPRAVKLVTDRKLSVAEVALRLGVGENLLRDRREALREREYLGVFYNRVRHSSLGFVSPEQFERPHNHEHP